MQESEIARLMALADEALALGRESEAVIAALERYAAAFTAWYDESRAALELGDVSADQERRLEDLLERHARILDLAGELRAGMREEMAGWQRKSRGILAYTDTLPRQISFRRGKKKL